MISTVAILLSWQNGSFFRGVGSLLVALSFMNCVFSWCFVGKIFFFVFWVGFLVWGLDYLQVAAPNDS